MSNSQPPTSLTGRAAEFLEWTAGIAIRLGQNGMILVVPLCIGYVLVGGFLTWTGLITFPYPFLSVTSDPVFNILGFIAGLAIFLGSAGLFILLLMNDLKRVGNQFAVLMLGISIGSSVAILRHTHEAVLASFLAMIELLLEFVGIM